MALSDVEIRTAKPKAGKASKLFDEHGLFLSIPPTGAKLWRFRYKMAGKEKLLALGAYPSVSLKEARASRRCATLAQRGHRSWSGKEA